MTDSAEITALAEAILDADIATASTILYAAAEKIGYYTTLMEILSPVLEGLGTKWDSGAGVSLAQGYVAGKVTEQFMAQAVANDPAWQGAKKRGTVIVGNIEDDFHSLGRRLVAIFLESAGWTVVDLGNDATAKEFVDQAIVHGARVIGASAMMYTTAKNIAHIREEINQRGLNEYIKLAVGGAVFKLRPELVQEVGGDGTVTNALLAPELFERLWNESKGVPHEQR